MHAESTERTLLEDWQARRERLAGRPVPLGQLGELHVQILDYLIGRYADSSEAARPARFSPKSDVYVNDRAIVVHHHLWQGKVSGVKSPQEAEARISGIVKRMIGSGKDRAEQTGPETTASPDSFLSEDDLYVPDVWAGVLAYIQWGCDPQGEIWETLKRSPVPPRRVVRYLCDRLADPSREDRRAADLLASCRGRGMPIYIVRRWRELLRVDRRDRGAERLRDFLCRLDVRRRVIEKIRAELADDSPAVRLEAIDILGRIGTLDDIGLLSDLLWLPPLEDEHPDERAALARAMQQISRAD